MSKNVIFGATSGIAIETARLWAARGDELCLVARDSEKLALLAQDLGVRGARKVETVVADLSDSARLAELLRSIDQKLPEFDTVLVAYGILGDQRAEEADFSKALKNLQCNFLSVAALLTEIANRFEAKRAGRIAVISSVAGDRGRQSNYVYGTAKGALNVWLQGLRNRLAKSGVSVTTIKPGFVATAMTAHLRQGPLFVKPAVVAGGIVRAIDKKSNEVYLPWFWWIIMTVIKSIPEQIFKRLKL